MEPMTWLETIELLGLDFQASLILALLGLDAFERALHSAWLALGRSLAQRSDARARAGAGIVGKAIRA
jgi:hypothetical protein